MASDFIHSEQVTARLVDIIEESVPASWIVDDGTDIPLRCIQHGDLRDHVVAEAGAVVPCVLVRSMGVRTTADSGTSGVRETVERMRIVMVRRFTDCTDGLGSMEPNTTRSRQRYGKELCKAVFADQNKRLRLKDGTALTLTSTDTNGAQVIDTRFVSMDYDGTTDDVRQINAMRAGMWAIAIDVDVIIRTGGR